MTRISRINTKFNRGWRGWARMPDAEAEAGLISAVGSLMLGAQMACIRQWVRTRVAAAGLIVLASGGAGPAAAAVYVVDPAAPGASDRNDGTEQHPFATIQHAADAARAGDTVCVMAGAYDERVRVRTSGAEGRPLTFCARPRRSARAAGFDLEGSYVRVEGFELTAPKPGVAIQLGGSHCEVLDNDIHDMRVGVAGTVGTPGPDAAPRDYSAVAHNRVAFNRVYHCEYGFVLGGEDWLVDNNEVDRLFMYAAGNRFDDCDYTRFFGKGCLLRANYFHGSRAPEIRTAHVDCLQTFTVNSELAQDLVFEENTCFDFHQMCMVESAPHIGNVRGWTFRRNIVSANAPEMSGGWGPDIIQTPEVTIEHNTICTVRWAAIGLRGRESVNGRIRNNILCDAERAVVDGDEAFSAAHPVMEYNLTFKTAPLTGGTNLNGKDPLFVDAAKRNFRLREGSPGVGAGAGGETVGALEYPNVYTVAPAHPAASDEKGWGYPAVPLATLAKACQLAQPGETILLRPGVYRETLRPANDGVKVRAAAGARVLLSGADLVEGWKREAGGRWSAPVASAPRKLLRDGGAWGEFGYDAAARRLVVTNGDPRLHVFETVVRAKAIDLEGRKGVTVEGITVTNTVGGDGG